MPHPYITIASPPESGARAVHCETAHRLEATVWSVPRSARTELVVTLVRHVDCAEPWTVTTLLRPTDLPAASQLLFSVEGWIERHQQKAD